MYLELSQIIAFEILEYSIDVFAFNGLIKPCYYVLINANLILCFINLG